MLTWPCYTAAHEHHAHTVKSSVAAISIFASAGMAAAKFAVGIAIGSLALISEALHSSVDVVATVITWLVVRVSDRPADEEHHYGHGKIESLSALGVIAMLYVLAGGILVESWSRLREGAPPPVLSAIPFVVLLIDIAVNFWRARALHRAARDTKSQALAADALHFASDVLGSIAVIIGLVLTGARLSVGRCRRRDRGRRDDLAAGPAAGALHRGNPARPRAGRRGGEGHRRDPGGARRGRGRAAARAHGRADAFHRRHRQSAAHLPDRPRRGDQANGAGGRQQGARRRRPDLYRGAGRARQ